VGDFTTAAIPFNASANQVAAALQALPSLASGTLDNVRVTAAEVLVEQTIRGRAGVNEAQTVTLPLNASAGNFTLTFQGETTASLAFNAMASDVETALEALTNIDDVNVLGNDGGPWTVLFSGAMVAQTDQPLMTAQSADLGLTAGPWTIEFIDDFSGKPIAPVTVDATNLVTQGNGEVTTQTLTTGGGGTPQLVSTKHFNTFVDVEHLRIDTGAGDDHVIIRGVPNFSLGIFYAADEGNDTLEIISTADMPNFVAPVFPNDDGATVMVDGRSIQFDSMEGGLTFNANGMAGTASSRVTMPATNSASQA
jgi:hypothetical protein